jgi:alpha-L-fucosidase
MNDNGMPTGGLQEYWETPQTLNTTWGYSRFDEQWKTPGEVIHRMVEIVGKGGNYLLNIGPMADGTVPAISVATLHKLGEWMQTNGESIYGATASPLREQPWGRSTVNGNRVYLHVFSWPADGKLRVPGLKNPAVEAYALAAPERKLAITRENGTDIITLPDRATDGNDTVFVLRLDGPPVVDPPTVTQGSDAPFELDYLPAVTAGKAVKRFNREGKFHIAKWTGPDDSIRWHLLVSQAGEYRVRLRYAAAAESRGNRYVIAIAGQTVSGSVTATGEAYQYRTFDLGTLRIRKAGPQVLEIKPAAEYGHNLMFFQSLELAPVGPLTIE